MDLAKQSAIILGGSSGMGLATARRLAAAGAAVTLAARDPARLAAAAASVNGRVSTAAFDARHTPDMAAFFEAHAPFNHLVLSLGSAGAFGQFADGDAQAFRDAFASKVWPYVDAMRLSLPRLAPDGSITLVAGSAARKAGIGQTAIAATNGALVAMVAPLALELAPRRVNAVCPGLIDTPYWDGVAAPRRAQMYAWSAAHVPVGRVGQADDVAQAVVYLISSSFTTGTVLDCNGGLHVT